MKNRHTIGFDRKIELAWLDAVAGKVAAGATSREIRAYLWRLLEGVVAGEGSRSARGKTVTVLMHIWVDVPEAATDLRDRAAQLIERVDAGQRVAIHWAMAIATYPFFLDVAATLGRLLALQGTATLAQVTRRVAERWGDRSTLPRAVQRVVRSMVQWGVLQDAQARGEYRRTKPQVSCTGPVALLLTEGMLAGELADTMPLEGVHRHPAFFPFVIDLTARELSNAPTITTYVEGGGRSVVARATRYEG